MRALASWSTERLALLPEIPTFKELGYTPSYIWSGVFVPAGRHPPSSRGCGPRSGRRPPPRSSRRDEKVSTPVSYLDAPEFKKYWDRDAARLKVALEKIGRVKRSNLLGARRLSSLFRSSNFLTRRRPGYSATRRRASQRVARQHRLACAASPACSAADRRALGHSQQFFSPLTTASGRSAAGPPRLKTRAEFGLALLEYSCRYERASSRRVRNIGPGSAGRCRCLGEGAPQPVAAEEGDDMVIVAVRAHVLTSGGSPWIQRRPRRASRPRCNARCGCAAHPHRAAVSPSARSSAPCHRKAESCGRIERLSTANSAGVRPRSPCGQIFFSSSAKV